MKKALIYGLTLTFALTLTACGQPKAEEPGAPDPTASAPVQTVSPETTEPTAMPELFEETPPAPAETDVQSPESTATEPEDTTPAQTPEVPDETETTQPTGETETAAEPETAPTTNPTQQTTQPSDTAQTPPSPSEDMSAADQAILEAVRRNKEQRAEEGYNSAHGNLTDEAMEAIGSSLSGGTPTTQPDTDSQSSTGQNQISSPIGDPVGDLANGNWQVSTGNPEWDEIFNGTPWGEDISGGRGDVDENGNVSNAGLNVQ